MRKLLILAALLAAPLAHGVTLVDRIVAVVNKEVITYSELHEAVGMAERQLARQGTPAPERPVLERQMLERLILDKAQLQMARESGIRVDELQLDRAVERVAQSNNLTLADFRRALESDGVSFDSWRNDVRQQMRMARLREREVENRVQVSETEIDVFLEQLKTRPEAAEYNLAHILVRVPEGASPERIRQARERAEQALAEAKGGAAFARVAASFSDAPDALQGGARRRARLGLPRRHGARVRARLRRAQGRRTEPAGAHAVRLSPDPGSRAPLERSQSGAPPHAGAPDAARAQGRRGLPGMAAPAARPDLRRVAA